MNKVVAGLVAGLFLGALVTWLMLRRDSAPAARDEVDPPSASVAEVSVTAGVHLSDDQQSHAGLIIASPQSGQLTPELEAFGRVQDSAPLISLVAEVEAARVIFEASEKEFARTQKLHADNGNASTQALETAQAAVARDRAQLAAARARLIGGWGPAVAPREDHEAFLHGLVTLSSALVRIDLPAGETPTHAPTAVRAGLIGAANLHTIEVIGPAPTADAQVQGIAYLAVWTGEPPPVGTTLRVLVPMGGAPQATWLLPRSALIRHHGSVFVYVQTSANTFARRRVVLAEPRENDVPVIEGLTGDERVVVTGGQQLLSTELDAGGEPD